MATPALNVLSLCSGYGGLDLGLDLATGGARTVCWVEWDAYPAALLVARMEDEALADAPVWSDARTFDGRPWRGVVDCVIGGYPCQPFSVAGKRAGAADPRHLWPHIARIVGEVRPRYCFFENVRNHVNIGLEQVRADLRGMGYRVEAGIFSAEEVGATHRRERLFILAHATSGGNERSDKQAGVFLRTERGEQELAHTTSELHDRSGGAGQTRRSESSDRCGFLDLGVGLADADLARLEGWGQSLGGSADPGTAWEGGTALVPAACGVVHNPAGARREWGQSGSGGTIRDEAWRGESRGRCAGVAEYLPLFPPGPDDLDQWSLVLDRHPELAPATVEPVVRGLADGPAGGLAGRPEQLRAGGNGVVPLQAAYAFHVLARQMGLDF